MVVVVVISNYLLKIMNFMIETEFFFFYAH